MIESNIDAMAGNLKWAMKQRGVTQYRLEKMTGIAQPSIAKYLQGEQMPSIPNLLKIADALEINLNGLFERKKKAPADGNQQSAHN